MSTDHNFPADRRYTKDHEWACKQGSEVLVGVSAFAVEQLGDITMVNIDVKEGDVVTAGAPLGAIESVKTTSDVFCPVGGTVVRVNAELGDKPELLNEDCWNKGWIVAIKPSSEAELAALMDAAAYTTHAHASAH